MDTHDTNAWAASVAAAAQAAAPAGVLLAHTLRGKDLGPRLAERLGAPMAADCTEVRVEGGTLVARRPVFAGKALVTVAGSKGPLVVSLRPNAVAAEEIPPPARLGHRANASPDNGLGAVLKVMAAASKKLELSEASIVVSGRRPGGPENFAMIEELAAALARRGSRAVVDAGWRPHGDQVGQTAARPVSPGSTSRSRSGRHPALAMRTSASSRSTRTPRRLKGRGPTTGSWATPSRWCPS